jgi:UTP--glucose-1-phosphate uridylyltransferase
MLTKAVIPAAGFGTRMLPAAKAVPKELLPVLDRPAIQYVVEEAADAGIKDVLLVTSRHKHAIEDHFDNDAVLEERLRASGKSKLLASVRALSQKLRIHATRQAEMRGLGDAVRHARHFAANDPILCMLPDAIFRGAESPAHQMLAAFAKLKTSIVGLEEVPPEKVDRYGIVGGKMIGTDVMRIETVVEKPALNAAPSRLAIAARYILTPAIFDCLDQTSPGSGGEIQLTDALQLLLAREPVHGVVLSAQRHDIGDPADWLATNLIFAADDKKLWQKVEPLIRTLLNDGKFSG